MGAMGQNGMALYLVSEEMNRDLEVVMAAVGYVGRQGITIRAGGYEKGWR